MAIQAVLGLMRGTPLDGVDVALLCRDGAAIDDFGPTCFHPCTPSELSILHAALVDGCRLADRTARPGTA